MNSKQLNSTSIQLIKDIDEKLSKRFINLDPKGYFLIKIDYTTHELIVEQFENDIDEKGRAVDKDTGEPIKCSGGKQRSPLKVLRGRSAKEIGIKLTEKGNTVLVSKMDHALYLGRELQKAEQCLIQGEPYEQD